MRVPPEPAPVPSPVIRFGASDGSGACNMRISAWAVETTALALPLRCPDAPDAVPSALVLSQLPDGASLDSSRGELHWTPGLNQAGDYTIDVSEDGVPMGQIEIDVADRFDDPDNVPVTDPEHYATENGLQVLHLQVSSEINADEHTPATLVYGGRRFRNVSAKYRGATSLNYPKRSFTVKFDKGDPFTDVAHGFNGARRVTLTTTFDDNSYLRQRLAFTLWNWMDEDHLAIRAFNVVVFLNGKYHGLYTLTDHVDDDYLEEAGVSEDGNLYKAREHDANFRLETTKGKRKKILHDGYTKEEGEPADDFSDLDVLIEWVATAEPNEFYEQFDQRMVQSEFEDWLIFTSAIAANDSADKNTYLYHDPGATGDAGRWRLLPWDFNASFGQNFATHRLSTDDYLYDSLGSNNAIFERLLDDERLRTPMLDRYRALLHGPWSLEKILDTYDAWAREIEPSALRDEQKWNQAYRTYNWRGRTDFTTHDEEIDYTRQWIEERWSILEDTL